MPSRGLVSLTLHFQGGPGAGTFQWEGMWPNSTIRVFTRGRYTTYERVGDSQSLTFRHVYLGEGALAGIRRSRAFNDPAEFNPVPSWAIDEFLEAEFERQEW